MAKTGKPTAPDGKHPKANKGSFGIGRDPLERLGGTPDADQPEGKKPLVPVEGTGLLGAMRHVLMNPAYHDTDPLHAVARELKRNPKDFATRYADLEKTELLSKGAPTGGGTAGSNSDSAQPAPPDLGTDRCLALIDDLLGDKT